MSVLSVLSGFKQSKLADTVHLG